MQLDYDKNKIVLDKKVILFQEFTVVNSYGSPETFLKPLKEVWASIEPISGKEYFIAEQVKSEATVKIIIRHDPCIKDRMVVIRKGSKGTVRYELKSPPINIHDEDNLVILMCIENTRYKENEDAAH